MSVIATDSTRLSGVVKYEFEPSLGLCREEVIINDAAATFAVGTVLGRYLAGGSASSAAVAGNTGNGTLGTVTVGATAKIGVYTLRISKAAANAGDFVVVGPEGYVVGNGTVGVAFNAAGLSFTLADGAADFIVGDSFKITVTGTYKYKKVEATATDGTDVPAAIYLADTLGSYGDLAVPLNTDTKAIALVRGKAIVSKAGLAFGATVNTADELAAAYAALEALQIFVEDAV